MLLTVYVDDFKLAGPAEHLESTWNELKQQIDLGTVEDVNQYLGCKHVKTPTTVRVPKCPTREATPGVVVTEEEYETREVNMMEYDMSEFLQSCLDKYEELAGG